jgi:Ca-activated chloride channel family protein
LKTRTSHRSLLAGEKNTLWLEVAVTGPKAKEKKSKRPPLDLVIVIDRSGSMSSGGQTVWPAVPQPAYQPPAAPGVIGWVAPRGRRVDVNQCNGFRPSVHTFRTMGPVVTGTAFDHARTAAQQVLGQLQAGDRSAVVVFDNVVDVIASLSEAHEANGRALDGVHPRGSTNLHGGLIAAIDQLAGADSGRQRRVFLLSDGQANVGVTDTDAIASEVRALAEQGVVVSTFGLGEHYNEDLLQAIAEAGGGGYHYLETADDAPAAFSAELSEVLRPSLAQVKLSFKPADGVKVLAKHGAGSELNRRQVVVGDVPAGATRTVYLQLQLSKKHAVEQDAVKLCDVQARYKRHGEPEVKVKQSQVTAAVTCDEKAFERGLRPQVIGQAAAFEAAEQQAQAAKLAQAGDHAGAQHLLMRNARNLSDVVSAGFATDQVFASLADTNTYSAQLAAGNLDGAAVKQMKFGAYRTRTSRA